MKKALPLLVLCGLVLLLTSCATTKSAPKAATKSEPKTAAKTEPKTTAKTEPKTAAKSETKAATKDEVKSDKAIADELNQRIKASGLKNVDVKITKRGVTITAGALNFPPDSAQIIPETATRLDAIARLFKGYETKKFLIQGHTADVGDKKSQKELSVKRAQAVADYFVRKRRLKASQLVIEGLGGTVPLASNKTDEGRAKNRRVEITLLR